MYATKGQVLMLAGVDSEIMDEISDLLPVEASGDGVLVLEFQEFLNVIHDGLDVSNELSAFVLSVSSLHGTGYDLITIRR
jgi:hypothetical protein